MPRPKTKSELIEQSQLYFDKLCSLIDQLSDELKLGEFHFDDRDRNIKDVLIHLHEWHKLLIQWVKSNLANKNKPFLPDGYNWKSYPKMNVEFLTKHTSTTYDNARELVAKSHNDALKIISKFSNDELFTKKYYHWTGTTSLGSYCVSSMSSHYDWAIKKIKKHVKTFLSEVDK